MALIDWTADLSVGIESIDEQHKKLIGLINNLNEAMKSGKAKAAIGDVLRELADYTVYHFSAEEKLMEQAAYSGLFQQRKEHAGFVGKLKGFQEDFKAGKLMLTLEIMNFLKEWISGHIKGSDKKYTTCLREKGIT